MTDKMLGQIIKEKAIDRYGTEKFQRMMANDCGMSNSTVSRIVKGEDVHPETATLRKISENLNIDYLLLLYLNGDIDKSEFKKCKKRTKRDHEDYRKKKSEARKWKRRYLALKKQCDGLKDTMIGFWREMCGDDAMQASIDYIEQMGGDYGGKEENREH